MKRLFCLAAMAFLVSCNNSGDTTTAADTTTTTDGTTTTIDSVAAGTRGAGLDSNTGTTTRDTTAGGTTPRQ